MDVTDAATTDNPISGGDAEQAHIDVLKRNRIEPASGPPGAPPPVSDGTVQAGTDIYGNLSDWNSATPTGAVINMQKQIRGSGGSFEPPGPLLTHPHTVYMAYSEGLPVPA